MENNSQQQPWVSMTMHVYTCVLMYIQTYICATHTHTHGKGGKSEEVINHERCIYFFFLY